MDKKTYKRMKARCEKAMIHITFDYPHPDILQKNVYKPVPLKLALRYTMFDTNMIENIRDYIEACKKTFGRNYLKKKVYIMLYHFDKCEDTEAGFMLADYHDRQAVFLTMIKCSKDRKVEFVVKEESTNENNS